MARRAICSGWRRPFRSDGPSPVVSQRRLSATIGISRHRLRRLVDGRIALGESEAEGLAGFFGTTSTFWTHPQADHDRALAKDALAETLGRRGLPID